MNKQYGATLGVGIERQAWDGNIGSYRFWANIGDLEIHMSGVYFRSSTRGGAREREKAVLYVKLII